MKAHRWVLFVLPLLWTVSAVFAQSKEGDVVVNIPFAFVVATQHLKPGPYVIVPAADGIVRIFDPRSASTPFHVPVHSLVNGGKGGVRVVFHCYGQACFLAEVWSSGQSGKQFYPSKEEREIIARRSNDTRNEVAVLQPQQ